MYISDPKKIWLLIVFIAFFWLLYLLSPILTPFVISLFLAYLGDPSVDRLQNMNFSRTLSVCIVFFVMLFMGLCFLFIVIPLLEEQIRKLFLRLPDIFNWLQFNLLPLIHKHFGIDLNNINLDKIKQSLTGNWQTFGDILSRLLLKISASGQFVLLWLGYIFLIPVVSFYLLRDWDILVEKIAYLIPRTYEGLVIKLAKDCDKVLAEFLRGQSLVMVVQGVIYSLGLWFIGLEFALLIGFVAALVSFIPYLGFIVGFSIASIAAFFQFHDFIYIFYVLSLFSIGQIIESMVLSPLLIGDRIGLHPVVVIFAVMAGAQLFGFLGMLLALPVAAVISVLLRYFHEKYTDSALYKT